MEKKKQRVLSLGAPATMAAAPRSLFGSSVTPEVVTSSQRTSPTAFTFDPSNFGISRQVQNDNIEEIKEETYVEIPGFQSKLDSPWREVQWTEEQKKNLMKTIISYKPGFKDVSHARVLLLGPVRSGKSSFISSVQSVFNGRVTNRAMVGSSVNRSFTKKLQSFNILAQKGEDDTRLVLCDIMGIGDGEMTGLTLHDVLSVIKGCVPEGHQFRPDQPVGSETAGYVKTPSIKDKIHCVAFVVDASKIATYHKGYSTTFQQLREHISELGVHQVALLTHVDQICPETAKDMREAGALLGMSTSYMVPVKNYSSELELDGNTDVLLLSAVDHILQYVHLFFQDYAPKLTGSKVL